MRRFSPLLHLLRKKSVQDFGAEDWSLLFSEARCAGVVERLAHFISLNSEVKAQLPTLLETHLSSAIVHAEGFRVSVVRELEFMKAALSTLDIQVLLLKGACYAKRELNASVGRIFNDIDILVLRENMNKTEAMLKLFGWSAGILSPYDGRYYREWSHEVPPMTHQRRGTTIDLHHSLAMPTCRMRIDFARMIGDSRKIDNDPFWSSLRNEDIVIHAAIHLMLNSEFNRGLRDLWDIDLLVSEFSISSPDFTVALMERAKEIGVEQIVLDTLLLCHWVFGTQFDESVMGTRRSTVFLLMKLAASTRHSQTRPMLQSMADFLLVLREMYLRLPNRLLLIHLSHKFGQLFEKPAETKI